MYISPVFVPSCSCPNNRFRQVMCLSFSNYIDDIYTDTFSFSFLTHASQTHLCLLKLGAKYQFIVLSSCPNSEGLSSHHACLGLTPKLYALPTLNASNDAKILPFKSLSFLSCDYSSSSSEPSESIANAFTCLTTGA